MLFSPSYNLNTVATVATEVGKETLSEAYDTASYYTPQFIKNIARNTAIGGAVGLFVPAAAMAFLTRGLAPAPITDLSIVSGTIGASFGLYKGVQKEINAYRNSGQLQVDKDLTNNRDVKNKLKP